MTKYLKDLIDQTDKHGFAIGSPIPLNGLESALVGNTYFLDLSQTLRHFIKFDYLAALLQNRALRLGPLDRFDDDPDEGKLSQANAIGSSNLGAQMTKQWGSNPETDSWKQFINGTQRRLIYVHCWFGQEEEDQAMWNRYGDGGYGVCLKTSVRRFEESLRMQSVLITQLGEIPGTTGKPPPADQTSAPVKRFYGTVTVDAQRINRDVSVLAAEIIHHLAKLPGTELKVTIEIQADVPNGVPEDIIRTVNENCRSLKFINHGFEKE